MGCIFKNAQQGARRQTEHINVGRSTYQIGLLNMYVPPPGSYKQKQIHSFTCEI